MKKSPINHAIETLQKFSESIEFTKEGRTAANCSISLIEPFIKEEKRVHLELCVDFLKVITTNIENGQIDNFKYEDIVSFIDNYFSDYKLPNGDFFEITNDNTNPNVEPFNIN
jgi:hypothetical protein